MSAKATIDLGVPRQIPMKTISCTHKVSRLISSASAVLLFGMSVASVSSLAWAADVTNFGSHSPTQEEFTRALKKTPSGADEHAGVRFRGIKPVTPAASPEPAVSIQLTFAFNSDQLSAQAKRTLDNLGQALQGEELRADRFRIEGHTDSKGSNAYNQRLSERRARSVARYLISELGVEPKRLQTVGKGETELLHPDDPENGENRRVQIVNLGS